jgi:CBS-domain-containing membrane protein
VHNVKLKEIMVTKVIKMGEEDHLSKVEEKIRQYHIRHLPIVDREERLVGIVTLRDLFQCAPPHRTEEGLTFDREHLDEFILKYIMTPNPVTLGPENTIQDAVEIMAREKYGCIPIVAGDRKLLGIVTQIDILKFLSRWLREETA